MKHFFTFIACCIVLFVALGVFLSFGDVEIQPEVAVLMEQRPFPSDDQNNGYYALLGGIDVSAENDPWVIGRDLVARYEEARGQHREFNETEFYDNDLRLGSSKELRDLCRIEREPCLAQVAANPESVARLAGDNALLLTRYRALRDYPVFTNTLTPSYSQPIPRFGGLFNAHRLWALDLARKVIVDQDEQAITDLVEDLRFLRRHLAQADTLIQKMVALKMLELDLHLIAQLYDVKGIATAGSNKNLEVLLTPLSPSLLLSPLSVEERSLYKTLVGEFLAAAQLFTEDMQDPDIAVRATSLTSDASWFMKKISLLALAVGFKTNDSVNQAYMEIVAPSSDLDKMSSTEFADYFKARAGEDEKSRTSTIASLFLSWPFNPAGNLFRSIAGTDFLGFRVRIHEIDGLLRLVRIKKRIRAEGIGDDGLQAFLDQLPPELTDPYTGKPMQYDGQRRVILYEGLLQNETDEYRTLNELPLYDLVVSVQGS